VFYEYEIPAPANTPETDPVELEFDLTPGRVVRGAVFFPDNSAGQLHLTLLRASVQVWPTNPDGDIRGNNQEIEVERHYDLLEPPYDFVARAWNEDDTYAHLAILRFLVVPIEETLGADEARSWLTRIAQRLGWKG
jgi:hypothetical protein